MKMRLFLSANISLIIIGIFFGYWPIESRYCSRISKCEQHESGFAHQVSVIRGKHLVQTLLNPIMHQSCITNSICCAQAHLLAIIDIMHYLDALAQAKRQTFCEGTFIIEDNGGHLFSFLKSYVQTYTRISSHFNEYCVQHYGLDIPVSNRSYLTFPSCKRHILFAQLDEHTLFIKPENYGTNIAIPTDVIMHCKEYVQYLVRKYMRLGFERHNWREEHVPFMVINTWHNFLRYWIDDPEYIAYLVKNSKRYGIKKIIEHLPKIAQYIEEPTIIQQAVHARLLQLLECYDHCHMRRGNEVILRTSELLTTALA